AVAIILKLFVLEHAAAGEPREHPVTASLKDFAELSLGEGIGAFKVNVVNFDFGRLGDLESDGGAAAALVGMRNGFDLGLRIAALLVELLDFKRIHEELPLVERIADFGSELLGELAIAVLFVPDEINFGELQLAAKVIMEINAAGCDFVRNPDIGKKTGGVKIA